MNDEIRSSVSCDIESEVFSQKIMPVKLHFYVISYPYESCFEI